MKTDSELQSDILEEFLWDPLVPEGKVGVAVSNGVVTLTGHLATYAEKVAAEHAVARVAGVKAVALEMKVVPAGTHQRSDTEIATAIEHVIEWSTLVSREKIKVFVENGWVSLEGELNWDSERQSLERMILPLKGVVGLTDHIVLKPIPIPEDLTGRIQKALTRQAAREARHIDVSVNGSVVTLTGKLHSSAEKAAAVGTTWSSPGVTRVVDKLTVEPLA